MLQFIDWLIMALLLSTRCVSATKDGSPQIYAQSTGTSRGVHSSGWGARDEEPLVNAGVNRAGCPVFALGNVELGCVETVGRVGNCAVGAMDRVRAVLDIRIEVTYRAMSPRGLLPVINFSQASAHSRTMSMAYL